MSKNPLWIIFVAILLSACAGEATLGERPDARPTTPPPPEPCTDPATCCTPAEQECLADPDGKSVCKCYKLWNCDANPKKCSQELPTPQGGSGWSCSWTNLEYKCIGTSSSAPGAGAWGCTNLGGDQWVCLRPSPPNPTNSPEGLGEWRCLVNDDVAILYCEKKQTPDLGAPLKLDAMVPKPDLLPPPPKVETNCADGIDNDNDGLVDCKDPDCPACPPPPCGGGECCDGIDNDGDGQIDEGGVCNGVGEPCPPGAYQACDCYCGVHRKCKADGTWGPCKVDGNNSCAIAQITSHSQCPMGFFCDYGKCVPGISFGCKQHSDCALGLICDLGLCIPDPYFPCP